MDNCPVKMTAAQVREWHLAKGASDVGFFLELFNRDTNKGLGMVELSEDQIEMDRIVGVYGRRELELTSPFEVQRGHRLVEIKASKNKPIRCWDYLYCHA